MKPLLFKTLATPSEPIAGFKELSPEALIDELRSAPPPVGSQYSAQSAYELRYFSPRIGEALANVRAQLSTCRRGLITNAVVMLLTIPGLFSRDDAVAARDIYTLTGLGLAPEPTVGDLMLIQGLVLPLLRWASGLNTVLGAKRIYDFFKARSELRNVLAHLEAADAARRPDEYFDTLYAEGKDVKTAAAPTLDSDREEADPVTFSDIAAFRAEVASRSSGLALTAAPPVPAPVTTTAPAPAPAPQGPEEPPAVVMTPDVFSQLQDSLRERQRASGATGRRHSGKSKKKPVAGAAESGEVGAGLPYADTCMASFINNNPLDEVRLMVAFPPRAGGRSRLAFISIPRKDFEDTYSTPELRRKAVAALSKGFVGPVGESGIKRVNDLYVLKLLREGGDIRGLCCPAEDPVSIRTREGLVISHYAFTASAQLQHMVH